jgi:hypothetical protein
MVVGESAIQLHVQHQCEFSKIWLVILPTGRSRKSQLLKFLLSYGRQNNAAEGKQPDDFVGLLADNLVGATVVAMLKREQA